MVHLFPNLTGSSPPKLCSPLISVAGVMADEAPSMLSNSSYGGGTVRR
jgi:hypothetical protein